MQWQLTGIQRIGFRTKFLAQLAWCQSGATSLLNSNSTPKVRQGKSCTAITTVDGSENREKSIILGYLEERTVTESPVAWREVSAKETDFSDKSFIDIAIGDTLLMLFYSTLFSFFYRYPKNYSDIFLVSY